MDLTQILYMNGGNGDTSYASNSLLQQKVISMTNFIREEAITDLYSSTIPRGICIADLGCSSGPTALLVVTNLVKNVYDISKKLGRDESPEFQIYLNDLPGNDFNSIFRSLPILQDNLKKELGSGFGPCLFTGVPGSFYDRLFPTKSLHFVNSSYSLMWLSQVPGGIEGNNGNIYMASTSPASVLKAYYDQFEKDFSMFLKQRSEEMVNNGRMVITILGRESDNRASKECCYIWELLAIVLNDMVFEGILEKEKLFSFNIPSYTPSSSELKSIIANEGSFVINNLEVSKINWTACSNECGQSDAFKDDGYNVAMFLRAVAEPLMVSHFGETIIDEVFQRYKEIISDRMTKERTEFVNVTVSMARKEW